MAAGCPLAMSPVFGVGKSFEDVSGFWPEGEDEDALSAVRCSDVGSSKARPVCVIPERGQVAEYGSEPATADAGDVLHDDELRSKNANAFGDGEPEPTTRSLRNAQCRLHGRRN